VIAGPDKPVMKTTQISTCNAMIDFISLSEPITGSRLRLRRIGRKPMGYRRSITTDYAAGMFLDAAAAEFFANAARVVTAA
jgi:hypothetical protein